MEEIENKIVLYDSDKIQKKIYTVRNVQVMLDSDLATFYGVETRVLNQAVKRNLMRFPPDFMFQLINEEFENWKSQLRTSNNEILISQIVISKDKRGGRQKLPFAFTEQGVAMLAGVLKSEIAVKISIQIINAFVSMRKFLLANAGVFQRLDKLEQKQIITDQKFEQVFNALQSKDLEPKQGIFFDGQIFDAYKFISGLIRKAEKSILLIDNYIDETVLDLFTKRKKNVTVLILTKQITKAIKLDLEKYNSQYPAIELKEFRGSHDRFLIIDNKDVYHIGASLKDLGKKWFAFSKFDLNALHILDRLKETKNDR